MHGTTIKIKGWRIFCKRWNLRHSSELKFPERAPLINAVSLIRTLFFFLFISFESVHIISLYNTSNWTGNFTTTLPHHYTHVNTNNHRTGCALFLAQDSHTHTLIHFIKYPSTRVSFPTSWHLACTSDILRRHCTTSTSESSSHWSLRTHASLEQLSTTGTKPRQSFWRPNFRWHSSICVILKTEALRSPDTLVTILQSKR
jgi:hypothetical protein